MDYLWLYLGLLTAWIFITLAEMAEKAVAAVKQGKKEWGGVSIMPGIMFMPIFFLLIALAVNFFWPPIGFWIVGSLHSLAGVLALGYVVYAIIYVKRNEDPSSEN